MPRAAFLMTSFSVGCTAVLSFLLMFPMSYGGLALAPSVAFSLSGLLGLFFIRGRVGRPLRIFSRSWLFKSALALSFMGVALLLYGSRIPYAPAASLLPRATWCLGAVAAGGLAYAAATLALRFDEWSWIAEALFRRKKDIS
jgi:putative peptidoglycan lipid II flippase